MRCCSFERPKSIDNRFEMKMISLKFVAGIESNHPKPNSVPMAGALWSVTSPQSTPANTNTPLSQSLSPPFLPLFLSLSFQSSNHNI